MDPNWSTRQMFERFIYEYLVKKNMHRTAQVFRCETNLQLDLDASSTDAMGIPEDFLQDWWSLNYDFELFRAWLQFHDTHELEVALGCNAFHGVGCSIEVMNPSNNSTMDETFNIGKNSMTSHVYGDVSQFFPPSSHQGVSDELSQFLLQRMRSNVTGANDREVAPSIQNTSKPQYTGFSKEPEQDPELENLIDSFWLFEQDQPNLIDILAGVEGSKNMDNLVAPREENTDRNELVGSPPELRDDDNKSQTSDVSSPFRINTLDADVNGPSVGIQ